MKSLLHLEQILEQEARTAEMEERLVVLAERLAHHLIVMTTAQHPDLPDRDQIAKIANQLLKTTEVETRDFEQVKKIIIMDTHLRNLLVTEFKDTLGNTAEKTLNELHNEDVILHDIEYIIRSNNPDKYGQLQNLIHHLLQIIHLTHEQFLREEQTVRRAA